VISKFAEIIIEEENYIGMVSSYYDKIYESIDFIDKYINWSFTIYRDNIKSIQTSPEQPLTYSFTIAKEGKGEIVASAVPGEACPVLSGMNFPANTPAVTRNQHAHPAYFSNITRC
jgi:hypothetical protein